MTQGPAAFHAFKWSVLGEAASKVIGPLIFLVLARILVPADFGVVAAATVIISFSQVLWEAGLAKALIQRQSEVDESAHVIFWLNMALGGVVFVLLLALAPFIAGFFNDTRITTVVRVLALQIPFAAFASVHVALLQKELRFRTLFNIRLLTTAVPGVASIPLAIIGYGYWALVAGVLVGQVIQTLVLWSASTWRPKLLFDVSLARSLLRFGSWVMLSSMLGWFYMWMDAIVVGHYLGSHEMGLYRTGNTFVIMIFGLVFPPLLPVLYTLFSRAQRDVPELSRSLITVGRFIAVVSLPIAFLLYTLSDQITGLVFNAEWAGISFVVGWLALAHGFSWIVGANGEVYRAIGKPNVETWATSIMLLVYLVVYLVSVRYGFEVFVQSRVVLAIVAIVAHVGVAYWVLKISPFRWVRGAFGPFAAALIMCAAISQLPIQLQPTLGSLTAHVAVGALVYLLVVSLTDGRFLWQLWMRWNPRSA